MTALFNMQSKYEIELSSAAAARAIYLGNYTALCRVLGHYKMLVDTRDQGIVPHLMLDGYWESWVTHAVARMVRPGWTVANVGANFGYFALLFADLVGASGAVLAFEPVPSICEKLKVSRAMNGFAHLHCFDRALSNREEWRTLERPVNFWNAHLLHGQALRVDSTRHDETVDHADTRRTEVKTLTLDHYQDSDVKIPNGRFDLVFIDAEGSEIEIWEGMAAVRRANPELITVMEVAPSRYPDPLAFARALAEDGKTLSVINHKGELEPRTPEQIAQGEHPGAVTGWGEEFMVVVQ